MRLFYAQETLNIMEVGLRGGRRANKLYAMCYDLISSLSCICILTQCCPVWANQVISVHRKWTLFKRKLDSTRNNDTNVETKCVSSCSPSWTQQRLQLRWGTIICRTDCILLPVQCDEPTHVAVTRRNSCPSYMLQSWSKPLTWTIIRQPNGWPTPWGRMTIKCRLQLS